jgi:hypothetical protein
MKGVTWRLSLLVFLISAAIVPRFAHAQVVIDEVMYNLSGSDNNGEWLEITNTGSTDADFTYVSTASNKHWKILGDGSTYGIKPYQGGNVLPAGGTAVIAIDPATFLAAWSGWTGILFDVSASSLKDSGESLVIQMPDGTDVDTFDYTTYAADKKAFGDGSSLQKQADNTWIAALPTPGAANSTTPYVSQNGDTNTDTNSSTDTSNATTTETQTQHTIQTSSYVPPPVPTLFADAGADRTVIVGADSEFDARAYDRSGTITSDTRFSWNFGDGSTAEGESVLHHYSYPGTYALVVTIANDKNAAMDKAVVTAEPAKLAFYALPDNGVEIQNLAGRDLDLSGWLVRAGAGLLPALFTLPPHSVILSGSSMHISRETLGFLATYQAELQYPNGVVALQAGQKTSSAASTAPVIAKATVTGATMQRTVSAGTVTASEENVSEQDDTGTASDTSSTTSETAAVGAAGAGNSKLWWFAAAALAAAACIAVVVAQRFGKGEWDIVEEKEG